MQVLIDLMVWFVHPIIGAIEAMGGIKPIQKLTEYMHTPSAAEYLRLANHYLKQGAAFGNIPIKRNSTNRIPTGPTR